MLLPIPEVLTSEQVAEARKILDAADWVDGRVTAGHQSARTKDNMQLPEDHPAARELGELILNALGQNPLFISAALPRGFFLRCSIVTRAGRRSAPTSTMPSVRSAAAAPYSHRSFGDLIFFPTGRVRRRRTDRRGHLRPAQREASGRAHGLYPSTSLHHVRR